MSRPCFSGYTQVALAACMTLAASACGNGLFTTSPLVETSDGGTGDGGVVVPPVPDGSGAFDAFPNQEIPLDGAAPDGAAPDGVAPDGATPDGLAPGSSSTQIIDSPGGDVTLGNATLSATVTVPRNAFAQPTIVTLTLISEDGDQAKYPGSIGPIFSLSKTDALLRPVTLQTPATFDLKFTPADASIPAQRVVLAYYGTQSNPNLWIAIAGSSYDATTDVLTGSVFEFSETRLFAPVESCLTGQACSAPQTCQGGACQ